MGGLSRLLDLDGSVLELHFRLQAGLQGLGRLQEGKEEAFYASTRRARPGSSPVTEHQWLSGLEDTHTAEPKEPTSLFSEPSVCHAPPPTLPHTLCGSLGLFPSPTLPITGDHLPGA